jgi:hypothetical protein
MLLILLIFLISILLIIEYRYKIILSFKQYYFSKKIHIKENMYLEYKGLIDNIFINTLSLNFMHYKSYMRYIFKDQVLIFINQNINTNETNINTFNYEKYNLNAKKDNKFITKQTFWEDSNNYYISNYINYLELNHYINKDELDELNKLNNNNFIRKINKIDNDFYNKIINFDNSVKIYYDYFVNMFNDYDKNIISIGLYGKSGTGKTMFLRNILKILEIYNKKNYCINNLYSEFTYNQLSKNIYFFVLGTYYPIAIIICTIDNFSDNIFQKIKELNNIKAINKKKIIILFETIEYTNYFDDFDITFKTNYQTNYQTNYKINKLE